MAEHFVWGTCMDGEVEIISYDDEKHREQSMEVLRRSFFKNEAVAIGSGIKDDLQAQKDLEHLCSEAGQGGVSLIAKHIPSGEIVGVSFNGLQTRPIPGEINYIAQFRDNHCFSESSKSGLNYMLTMDTKVNLFERFNIDCLLEIMFLSTLIEYEGKGIATKLVSYSVDLATALSKGQAPECLPEDARQMRPKLVSALFTSRISQRVGAKNGFSVVHEVPYDEFSFQGKTYAERIGPDHPTSILVVKEI
ncbi:uncharacterized protein LOC129758774 [Uranotaenia lowii]|uniref:uncharacterized protein LOC129758774 n=1 Tax=Uranotaenia lowii TaxID=190385 RepID=UPI00247892B5|nr:uncharacterized protein LOC129758774 [Uranotaenia lowii]XP_055612366.1 uncharacterized protein LOC129758774 [Uranotaenia lowii]